MVAAWQGYITVSGAGALVAQTIRIAEQDFGGFGRACANQTDLNGDGFDDLVVSNGNKVYVFEGSKAGGEWVNQIQFFTKKTTTSIRAQVTANG